MGTKSNLFCFEDVILSRTMSSLVEVFYLYNERDGLLVMLIYSWIAHHLHTLGLL